MSAGSLRTGFMAILFASLTAVAYAQTWSAGSESRDVWWVDEETTAPASPAPKPDVVSLDAIDTGSQPAKAGASVEPANPDAGQIPVPQAGKVSDLLTGREESVSAKPAAQKPKPTPRESSKAKPGDDEPPRSSGSRGWVSRTGSVVSVQPAANNNLQVVIETSDGTLVEGLISPHIRVRVPDKGTRVRVRGPIEGTVEGTESLRVFELERLGPRAPSGGEAPVRRPVRPPPPPYSYPVW